MDGDICYFCGGTGERDPLSGAPCFECNGTGWREESEDDGLHNEECTRGLCEFLADRESMTDREIVDKCNALARQFYACRGYDVPEGYRFDQAHHPQEQEAWDMACLAFEELLQTDPNEAISNLEDE